MCGLDKYILDKDTEQGFDFHNRYDHNVWNYVYFIIHLKQKDPSDFNGTESYINGLLEKEDMVWFPQHKSIRMKQFLDSRKKGEAVEEEGEIDIMSQHLHKFGSEGWVQGS